jgi:hypothetical protein
MRSPPPCTDRQSFLTQWLQQYVTLNKKEGALPDFHPVCEEATDKLAQRSEQGPTGFRA